MNKHVAKKIQSDERKSKGLLIVGIAALVAGFFISEAQSLLWGLGLGLSIAGAGTLLVYKKAKQSPAMQENIILELDERNQSLNTRAAAKAFWLVYYWIGFATLCSTFDWISAHTLLIATLFVMPGIYFFIAVVYHKIG